MSENHQKSYKSLVVWQRSMELVKEVYAFCKTLPRDEVFGISSQLKRCAVSIASNIAEGKGRGTAKDFRSFLVISQGSCYELETQLEITRQVKLGNEDLRSKTEKLVDEVMRMLASLINSLSV